MGKEKNKYKSLIVVLAILTLTPFGIITFPAIVIICICSSFKKSNTNSTKTYNEANEFFDNDTEPNKEFFDNHTKANEEEVLQKSKSQENNTIIDYDDDDPFKTYYEKQDKKKNKI